MFLRCSLYILLCRHVNTLWPVATPARTRYARCDVLRSLMPGGWRMDLAAGVLRVIGLSGATPDQFADWVAAFEDKRHTLCPANFIFVLEQAIADCGQRLGPSPANGQKWGAAMPVVVYAHPTLHQLFNLGKQKVTILRLAVAGFLRAVHAVATQCDEDCINFKVALKTLFAACVALPCSASKLGAPGGDTHHPLEDRLKKWREAQPSPSVQLALDSMAGEQVAPDLWALLLHPPVEAAVLAAAQRLGP